MDADEKHTLIVEDFFRNANVPCEAGGAVFACCLSPKPTIFHVSSPDACQVAHKEQSKKNPLIYLKRRLTFPKSESFSQQHEQTYEHV